jgi:hypothetical protein
MTTVVCNTRHGCTDDKAQDNCSRVRADHCQGNLLCKTRDPRRARWPCARPRPDTCSRHNPSSNATLCASWNSRGPCAAGSGPLRPCSSRCSTSKEFVCPDPEMMVGSRPTSYSRSSGAWLNCRAGGPWSSARRAGRFASRGPSAARRASRPPRREGDRALLAAGLCQTACTACCRGDRSCGSMPRPARRCPCSSRWRSRRACRRAVVASFYTRVNPFPRV